ncbi:hypothetical protein KAJ83_06905 [Marivibrio halodurans]|uniref:Uncharacterized protein n=1 Tax=Marivibrio halodurans TaxID=2039722 RepID=A0A8J7SM66_9PROT|nr:hypothetical protein [Marivibrio halodurans]MBP5856731.1 hypothetical protein [Marivibrio halodurans]
MKLTKTYRRLVRDTTINDTSLLSTDYLNHFNELVMMLEMVGDMPEMLDEAGAWRFKSYQQHFADSVFQHKDLAVWAYEHAPDIWREPFDRCTAAARERIEAGLPRLDRLRAGGETAAIAVEAPALSRDLVRHIETMSAIINAAISAEEARALADGAEHVAEGRDAPVHREGATTLGQSDIDKLFD